jgi:argininosuccinate lyase
MKLSSGNIQVQSNTLLDEFNASIDFDKELYKEDIIGSLAHSKMLYSQNILNKEEYKNIQKGLLQVKTEIENGSFEFKIEDEDIHMSIEKRLTEIIGDDGKKLHTARSRNDQVATDFRLYVQKSNKELKKLILELSESLLELSRNHTKTLLPGMTHLQHAQPINFAFHLLAYVSMLRRDFDRFDSSFKRNNLSPLGCAALAGTPHDINRDFTARELSFDAPSYNCLDTVSDRDFALEILFNISTMMMHLSRFSEELILWSSYEFKFITISDEYATGSSIMPQKKNPDVPELIRGKSGRVYGNLFSLFTVMKGLPLAYNKDTQEDKEGVFDSVKTAKISLKILSEVIKGLKVNKKKMKKASRIGHLSATDLADYLVQECNVPFREAYKITGKAVQFATSLGKDISELDIKELKKIDSRIKKSALKKLNLENSMNSRNSFGGTSTKQTQNQIELFEEWLKNANEF